MNEIKWVPAPQSDGSLMSSDVPGVYLDPDEEVEWIYMNNRVIGYVVRKKQDGAVIVKFPTEKT